MNGEIVTEKEVDDALLHNTQTGPSWDTVIRFAKSYQHFAKLLEEMTPTLAESNCDDWMKRKAAALRQYKGESDDTNN